MVKGHGPDLIVDKEPLMDLYLKTSLFHMLPVLFELGVYTFCSPGVITKVKQLNFAGFNTFTNLLYKALCKDMGNLQSLRLENSNFEYMAYISGLKHLVNLDCSKCKKLSTRGCRILNLPELRMLNISETNFDRLQIVSSLKQLQILQLQGCKN
eukprot:UN32888